MTQPTDAPSVIADLSGAGRTPVLVVGGTGTLGRAVTEELRHSRVPVRVLTRTPRSDQPDQVTGDLRTGAGLDEAVAGVQAVVHCATDPAHAQEVDVDGTTRLLEALRKTTPTAHLVYVSIVGAAGNPLGYYRAKVAAESRVTASEHPTSILRASQFHDLVEQLTRAGIGPLRLGIRGLRFASVDPAFVATRAVDLALSAPRSEPLEVAGPEILSGRDLAVLTARLRGDPAPRVLPIPALGGVLGAFSRGSNLPGPQVERGGTTYAEWWAQHHRSP